MHAVHDPEIPYNTRGYHCPTTQPHTITHKCTPRHTYTYTPSHAPLPLPDSLVQLPLQSRLVARCCRLRLRCCCQGLRLLQAVLQPQHLQMCAGGCVDDERGSGHSVQAVKSNQLSTKTPHVKAKSLVVFPILFVCRRPPPPTHSTIPRCPVWPVPACVAPLLPAALRCAQLTAQPDRTRQYMMGGVCVLVRGRRGCVG